MSLITFSPNTPAHSADVNSNFEYVENLAQDAAVLGGQFAQDADTTAALAFGYTGGNFRNDNTITAIAAGTVNLTDDTTNYIEVNASGVTANTTGFTSGRSPLYVAVTADGTIDSVADKRAWAFLSNSPGDMLKSTYDTDNDGVVDAAESAPWAGITDKPDDFTPSAHAASHGDGGDDEIAIDSSQVTTGTMATARLPVMGGATSIAAGTAGMAPAPAAGDDTKVLFGDGTYKTPPGADGTVSSVNTRTGAVTLDSSDVGLDNVTNDAQLKAADLDTDSSMAANSDTKIPSQKAVKTALGNKLDTATTQTANRILAGPASGSAAAPTFRALTVDDIPADDDGDLTANSDSVIPTQKAVKTYVDANAGGASTLNDLTDVSITSATNGQVLKYDGSDWINDDEAAGLSLGETSSTAYRGDRGKTAYDHSQLTSGNPHNVSLSDLSITASATELNYVDGVTSSIQTQLNAKAADSDVVKLTGAQTVAGVKTFSSSPIVPAPTTDMQAATKKYVDDNIPSASAIDDLTDVTITSASNGQVLTFDGSDWVNDDAASGAATATITASEALSAGDIVNVYDDTGETVQKASAADATKPATGFVLAGVSAEASATVYFAGSIITGLSGLTPGAAQYLDTTAGGITATAPDGTGEIVQFVGTALSATTLLFTPGAALEL